MKIIRYDNILQKREYYVPEYNVTIFHKSEFEIDAFKGCELNKFNEVELDIVEDTIIKEIIDIVNERERLLYVMTKLSHDFIGTIDK